MEKIKKYIGLGIVIFLTVMVMINFKPYQQYNDFISGLLSWDNSNKSLEYAIQMATILLIFAAFYTYGMLKERFDEEIFFDVVPAVALLLINLYSYIYQSGNLFLFYLMVIYYASLTSRLLKKNSGFVTEDIFKDNFIICMALIIVELIAAKYLFNMRNLSNEMFMAFMSINLVVSCIATSKFRNNINYISYYLQLIIPFILLLKVDTEYGRLNILIKCAMYLLVLVHYIIHNPKIKSDISITTIITLTLFGSLSIGGQVYIPDLFHIGELILPYQQIYELGQVNFNDFISVQGYLGVFYGFINSIILNNTYLSFGISMVIVSSIFKSAIIGAFWCNIKGLKNALLVTLFTIPVMNIIFDRFYLMIFITLVLAVIYKKDQYRLFTSIYFLLSLVGVVLLPSIGICTAVSIFPVYLYVHYLMFLENNKKITVDFIVQFLLALTIFMINHRYFIDLLINLQLNKSINDTAYGISFYHDLVYIMNKNFMYSFTKYLSIILVSYFLYLLAIKKSNLEKQECLILLASSISYFFINGYLYARIDSSAYTRVGSFSLAVASFYLPIILNKRITTDKIRSILVLMPLLIVVLTNGGFTDILRANNINAYSGLDYVEYDESTKLGSGYIDSESKEYLNNIKNVFDKYLSTENQTFYDFTNQSALYFIFNKKVPGLYSSNYTSVGSDLESMIIEELKEKDIALVLIGPQKLMFDNSPPSLRSYRIFKYFINQNYVYQSMNGIDYLVRRDIVDQSLSIKMSDRVNLVDISDDNWIHGVSTDGKTLLVEGDYYNKPELITVDAVNLNGILYNVVKTFEKENFIYIELDQSYNFENGIPKEVVLSSPYYYSDEEKLIKGINSAFSVRDLGFLPSSWGKSFESLSSRINLSVDKINHEEAKIDGNAISKKFTFIDSAESSDYDFIIIDIIGGEFNNLTFNDRYKSRYINGILRWSYDGSSYYFKDEVKFNISSNKLIIPIGAIPSWGIKRGVSDIELLIDKNSEIKDIELSVGKLIE